MKTFFTHKFLFYSLFLISCLAFLYFGVAKPFAAAFLKPTPGGDFAIFYTTAIGLRENKNIYDYGEMYKLVKTAKNFLPTYQFKDLYNSQLHPPVVTLLILPLSFLSYRLALAGWIVTNVFLLLLALWFLAKSMPLADFSQIKKYVFLLTLAFFLFPLYKDLWLGQTQTVVLLFLSLSLYFLKQSRQVLAGFFLSGAVLVKLIPALFLLFLLLKRRYTAFFCSILALILMLGFVHLINPSLNTNYLSVIKAISSYAWEDPNNQALSGFMFRLFGTTGTVKTLIYIFSFLLVLTASFFAWRSTDLVGGFSLFVCLMLIISTKSFTNYFLWLLIPFSWLASYANDKKIFWWLLAYLLVVFPYGYSGISFPYDLNLSFMQKGFFSILTSPYLYATFILAVLLINQLRANSFKETMS